LLHVLGGGRAEARLSRVRVALWYPRSQGEPFLPLYEQELTPPQRLRPEAANSPQRRIGPERGRAEGGQALGVVTASPGTPRSAVPLTGTWAVRSSLPPSLAQSFPHIMHFLCPAASAVCSRSTSPEAILRHLDDRRLPFAPFPALRGGLVLPPPAGPSPWANLGIRQTRGLDGKLLERPGGRPDEAGPQVFP
jgi:hypothetical protein